MRREVILKIVCGAVLALVVYRLGLAIVHINPLYHVTIPALPALASATNSSASTNAAKAMPVTTGTPAIATAPVAKKAGNSVSTGTNSIQPSANIALGQTHLARSTNAPAANSNLLARATNNIAPLTNSLAASSNVVVGSAGPMPGSEAPPPQMAGNNFPPSMPPGHFPRGFPAMPHGGIPGMPGMAGAGPALPREIQTRIDRVIDSEILAPVMRPMPMALLGIAGTEVFLRAPNGQTGLIKEGEALGGVKLIRIGVNRVLVEEEGKQKELTIFAGLGGESLLSKQNDSPK